VYIRQLSVANLRCLQKLELTLQRGLNVFMGPNGAGKTSILEAAALLGSGRSFRAGGKDALITRGADKLVVFAELEIGATSHEIGFERTHKSWRGRLDGADVTQLAQLVRLAPIWVIEPNSHALISGGSEPRRALLDWLLFHVEPTFAAAAARYRSVLKQRNAALKAGVNDAELAPWTEQVLSLGVALTELRAQHVSAWMTAVRTSATQLLPELGAVQLDYRSGWSAEQEPAAAMRTRLARDRALGYTSAGPHRADWCLSFAKVPERDQYSRGQAKNACLAAVLGTLARYHTLSGEKPLLCLDDLFSELDQAHQAHCLRLAFDVAEQVLVTGVAHSDAISAWPGDVQLFSVSDGVCSEL
jgi:DNA replication and repair protein RecF